VSRRSRPLAARPGDAAPVVAAGSTPTPQPVVDAAPVDLAATPDELFAQVRRLEAALAAEIERGQKELADQTARFNARWAEREADFAASRGAPPEAPHGPSGAPRGMRALVLSGLFFRGKQYDAGAEMPFDPESPPADLGTKMVEGVHYIWAR